MQLKLQNYCFFCIIVLIFSLSVFIQSHIFLNADVAWLSEASSRMLAGGTYTHDFFENNPPWILYFYTPAVLLGKIFSFNLVVSIRIYVYALIAISLGISNHLLQKIFSRQDFAISRILIAALAFIYLISPMKDFAQREHLLFILSMPYLLMIVLRLQGQVIPAYMAIIIGFLAGSVFLLKPYFLMTLFLVEFYYALNKKNMLAWVRYEIGAMAVLLLAYIFILAFRHADYLTTVVPYAAHWCYFGSKRPWVVMIVNQDFIFSILAFLFCLAVHEINQYKRLTAVLLLAFAGFLFSYFVQRVDYTYRLLPLFSVAMFMNVLFFCLYVTRPYKKMSVNIFVGFFTILMLLFLCSFNNFISYNLIVYPLVFFCFMAALLASILYLLAGQVKANLRKFLSTFLFSLLMGCAAFYIMALFDNWSFAHVVVTCCAFALGFCLFLPGGWKDKAAYVFVIFLGILLFILACCDIHSEYDELKQTKLKYQKLTMYINNNALHQSVYFFSANLWHPAPALIYSQDTTSASRFSGFWMIPGLVKADYFKMNEMQREQLLQNKSFFIDMVSEDLAIKKPKLVFVDALDNKTSLFFDTQGGLGIKKYIPLDYLNYFGGNKNFINVWKNYRFVTTLKDTVEVEINPLQYSYRLFYQRVPADREVEKGVVCLYLRGDGNLEVALRDYYDEVVRIGMYADDEGFGGSQILVLKQMLARDGVELRGGVRDVVFSWLARRGLVYPFYKFDVYEERGT